MERFFVTKVIHDRWTNDLAPGSPLVLSYTRALLETAHRDEMARLRIISDQRLQESIHD